jgi:hypothetical protein
MRIILHTAWLVGSKKRTAPFPRPLFQARVSRDSTLESQLQQKLQELQCLGMCFLDFMGFVGLPWYDGITWVNS